MSDDKDNIVRVDFRNRRVLSDAPDGAQSDVSAGDPAVDTAAPSKLEQFSGMLEHGVVLVTLDTRVAGVEVPEQFRGTPQLHLSFSLRYRLDDLEYDHEGVRATLSFDNGPFRCAIPWAAVYGMSSEALDERLAFPDSFPAELLALLPMLADSPDDD